VTAEAAPAGCFGAAGGTTAEVLRQEAVLSGPQLVYLGCRHQPAGPLARDHVRYMPRRGQMVARGVLVVRRRRGRWHARGAPRFLAGPGYRGPRRRAPLPGGSGVSGPTAARPASWRVRGIGAHGGGRRGPRPRHVRFLARPRRAPLPGGSAERPLPGRSAARPLPGRSAERPLAGRSARRPSPRLVGGVPRSPARRRRSPLSGTSAAFPAHRHVGGVPRSPARRRRSPLTGTPAPRPSLRLACGAPGSAAAPWYRGPRRRPARAPPPARSRRLHFLAGPRRARFLAGPPRRFAAALAEGPRARAVPTGARPVWEPSAQILRPEPRRFICGSSFAPSVRVTRGEPPGRCASARLREHKINS
jgi:hypothetical protein